MYRIIRVSWEWPYENAPKPSCHPKRPATHAFRLTKLAEPILTSCTKSDSATRAADQRVCAHGRACNEPLLASAPVLSQCQSDTCGVPPCFPYESGFACPRPQRQPGYRFASRYRPSLRFCKTGNEDQMEILKFLLVLVSDLRAALIRNVSFGCFNYATRAVFITPAGLPVYSLQRPPIHHPPFVFRRRATRRRMEITCGGSRAAENKRLNTRGRDSINRQPVNGLPELADFARIFMDSRRKRRVPPHKQIRIVK